MDDTVHRIDKRQREQVERCIIPLQELLRSLNPPTLLAVATAQALRASASSGHNNNSSSGNGVVCSASVQQTSEFDCGSFLVRIEIVPKQPLSVSPAALLLQSSSVAASPEMSSSSSSSTLLPLDAPNYHGGYFAHPIIPFPFSPLAISTLSAQPPGAGAVSDEDDTWTIRLTYQWPPTACCDANE
jgi:hypothetical protein